MAIEISADKSRLDIDVIHGYLTQSYWNCGIGIDKVMVAIEHSLCWGLYEEGKQVGFARVVTDQSHFAYLADVFILPECQGRGLGKALLTALFEDSRLQGLRRFMLATRDAHDLYEQFGFERVEDPSKLMAKRT